MFSAVGSLLYVRLRLRWPSAESAAKPAAKWSPTAVGSKVDRSTAAAAPASAESDANLIQASVEPLANEGVVAASLLVIMEGDLQLVRKIVL